MVKVYGRGDVFDFPCKKRRLAWYVEILCSRLLELNQISEDNLRVFWDEIGKKQRQLPFSWQRDNLAQEAKERLDSLLKLYEYDPKTRVYKRNT